MNQTDKRVIPAALLFALLLQGAGCATVTAALTAPGTRVEIRQHMTEEHCDNLGPVFGKGGGAFGGAFISDERLMEYATNDLRNKAAVKGANVVVFSTHQMAGATHKQGTSTATITGIAYRCL